MSLYSQIQLGGGGASQRVRGANYKHEIWVDMNDISGGLAACPHKNFTFVTGFWKITHTGTNDTVNI